MTCNFFTIIKSYFVCCNPDKKNDDSLTDNIVNTGVISPYTFEDLTNNSDSINSNWSSFSSSCSSLEDYRLSEKQQQQLKESIKKIKKYNKHLLHQRNYADIYETSTW